MAKPKKDVFADSYIKGILDRDITVLSKAITLVESTLKSDLELAQEIIEKCLPHSGNSIRIAVSGIPGAGKSSFTTWLVAKGFDYMTDELILVSSLAGCSTVSSTLSPDMSSTFSLVRRDSILTGSEVSVSSKLVL